MGDCQLNLTALLNTQELQTYSNLTYYEDMLKPFRLLKKKWAYLGYNSIKELHKFFSYFLEIIFFNLTKNFYKNFYKKKLLNLQTKFMLSNLFYYRQINKISDQYLDLHYNLSNPSYNFNFSQKENYVYNLNKIRYFGKDISEKLDVYLRNNVVAFSKITFNKVNKGKRALNSLFNLRKKYLTLKHLRRNKMFAKYFKIGKRNQSRLIYGVLEQIHKYRNYRWSQKFHKSINSLLEIGSNLQLPKKYEKKRRLQTKFFLKNENGRVFRRITKRIFAKAVRKIYVNKRIKMEEEVLTNTFLCVYNNLKKKPPYSKLFFWFNLNVN